MYRLYLKSDWAMFPNARRIQRLLRELQCDCLRDRRVPELIRFQGRDRRKSDAAGIELIELRLVGKLPITPSVQQNQKS
jgi:hypothetical protein